MNRILKIFSSGPEQDALARNYSVFERYPAFVLVDVPAKTAKDIARTHLTEDITSQYRIETSAGVIDTTTPKISRTPKTKKRAAAGDVKRLSSGPHHYLVQFVGPVKRSWLKDVAKTGCQLREPYGGFTYIVRCNSKQIAAVSALPFIRWSGHLPHRDRISSAVRAKEEGSSDPAAQLPRRRVLPGALTVEFFSAQDLKAALPAVKRIGFKVLDKDREAHVMVIQSSATGPRRKKQIDALSAVHGVRKIRERAVKRTANDVAAGIMGTAATIAQPGLGLSGKGEIIAIADTGIDTGDKATVHIDFRKRIKSIMSYPITPDFARYIHNPGADDGAADFDSGHGTHVSGSVLGNGAALNGVPGVNAPVRGLSYKARLVFQAIEQDLDWIDPKDRRENGRYILAGIPQDLTELFQPAYAKGARIHSNSWGGGDPGAYDVQCRQLDAFVWDHDDFCIVVAAGNDGTDKDADGEINPMSVTSPGTAKNCITVGACENLRPNFNSQRYGGADWWPDDYPVAPFHNDPMANNPNQVVPFSSRGPTRDGRFKPDVIAPGTFILSTRSTMIALNNTAWAPFPLSRMYFYMGGTSMATPLTAGAIGLVREYLRKKKRITRPSAALLKAALIAGAIRLAGYASKGALVDQQQGYGRINLDNILAPAQPASAKFIEVRSGLQTGDLNRILIQIRSGNVPLRIVLAYSDYPGSALVNNLNLIVRAPDNRVYAGNQRADGSSLELDNKNNVEAVQVDQPPPGEWSLEVVGANVPQGPQPFALVVLGDIA
jgi:serine protease AprX